MLFLNQASKNKDLFVKVKWLLLQYNIYVAGNYVYRLVTILKALYIVLSLTTLPVGSQWFL